MVQEKITDHTTVKKKRKIDRFKGMSEEEVLKRLLPDHLAPDLDIVIVCDITSHCDCSLLNICLNDCFQCKINHY